MPGFCKHCGTLLNNRVCPECGKVEPKKVLEVHFIGGEKVMIHDMHPELLSKFVDLRWEMIPIPTTSLKKDDETIFIQRSAISYFRVREIAE